MTRKERWFCDSLIRRVANGGDFDERTLTLAALESFGFGIMSDETAEKTALRRAKRLLQRPDVRARMAGLFENAQFFVTDAVKKHVEHIRSGNYAALKDYWAMTQGPLPKQVIVQGAVAHVEMSVPIDRVPKPMAARSLTGKDLVLDGVTGEVREATVKNIEPESMTHTVMDDALAYERQLDKEIQEERESGYLEGAFSGPREHGRLFIDAPVDGVHATDTTQEREGDNGTRETGTD